MTFNKIKRALFAVGMILGMMAENIYSLTFSGIFLVVCTIEYYGDQL